MMPFLKRDKWTHGFTDGHQVFYNLSFWDNRPARDNNCNCIYTHIAIPLLLYYYKMEISLKALIS